MEDQNLGRRMLRAGILTTMTMFFFLLLSAVLASMAQAEVTSVYVGAVAWEGYHYIYKDGAKTETTIAGMDYDPSSNTLTLDNFDYSGYADGGIKIDGTASDTVNVVLKGKNTLTPTSDAFVSGTKLVFSGSSFTMSDCTAGIKAAAVTIKSGTYSISGCSGTGISGDQYVKLEGGTCKITTKSDQYALYSENGTISNKPARLGSVTGRLGEGARYKATGLTCQVTGYGTVRLQRYGGSSKKVTVDESAFGGVDYGVTAILAKAFKNSKGAKIKTLTLGSRVRTVGKKAFFGMKKLTKLDLRSNDYYMPKSGGKFNKKAFSGCGKKKGRKLTVRTGWSSKSYINKARKALIKKGLSKKAKVKK